MSSSCFFSHVAAGVICLAFAVLLNLGLLTVKPRMVAMSDVNDPRE
jgi:hypothetical protein